MRIQFDLRPVSLLEKERKRTSFNFTRIVALLLFLGFVGTSGFYLGTMTLKIFELNEEIEMKQDEISRLDTQKRGLQAEIQRLQAQEKVFMDTLAIMQTDLPTVEVLGALESNLEYGMGLASLVFSQPRAGASPLTAVLNATAGAEEQIIFFTDGLSSSGVFSDVTMPTSKRDEKTGRLSFTLNLALLPIGQIRSATAR